MRRRKQCSRIAVMTLFALLFMVACGAPTPSSTATLAPTPPTTPLPTPVAEVEEWDHVALGESITVGMVDRYAESLEQGLGVKIDLHDWQVPGEHSSRLLEKLRSNELLRRELQEAEVITFLIPLSVISGPMRTLGRGEPGACGGADNQDCL